MLKPFFLLNTGIPCPTITPRAVGSCGEAMAGRRTVGGVLARGGGEPIVYLFPAPISQSIFCPTVCCPIGTTSSSRATCTSSRARAWEARRLTVHLHVRLFLCLLISIFVAVRCSPPSCAAPKGDVVQVGKGKRYG